MLLERLLRLGWRRGAGTMPDRRFPDAVTVVLVRTDGITTNGVSRIPADYEALMPLRYVTRYSGADDGITDFPMIAVSVLAEDYAEALAVSEDIRQSLIDTPWTALVNGRIVVVDTVDCTTGPREIDWGDEGVRRLQAEYTVHLRRPVLP